MFTTFSKLPVNGVNHSEATKKIKDNPYTMFSFRPLSLKKRTSWSSWPKKDFIEYLKSTLNQSQLDTVHKRLKE